LKKLTQLAAIILFAVSANAADAKKTTKATAKPAQSAPATAAPAAQPRTKSLHDQFSGQGYGLAGCGLGSIVFGAKPGLVQIAAATTNAYGMQTFAITTGTSNCDIPRMGQTAAVYIEANKAVVMKDASRGEGETMSDLALIYNCSNTQLFSEKVQNNYSQIFNSSNAYDSSRAILNTIKSDSALAATCQIAG
jgi:Protein of unknown function (DUF3015)